MPVDKLIETATSNQDAEHLVLGSLISSGDAESFALAREILTPSSFTLHKHEVLFRAMEKLWLAGKQISCGTVTLQVREDQKQDAVGSVVDFVSDTSDLANLGEFCEAVAEAERKRNLWTASQIIQTEISSGASSKDIIESTEAALLGVRASDSHKRATKSSEIIDRAGGLYSFITPPSDGIISTPFERLNSRIGGGLRRGQVWTLGGLSGSGKSSFAYILIEHAIFELNKRVKIISLEIDGEELLHNLVCTRARVDSQRARSGNISAAELDKLCKASQEYAVAMDDYLEIEEGCSTVPAIASSLRANIAQGRDTDLLVIDFIQLLSGVGKFSSRREEVDQIAYGVKKQLAKAFRIPVLSLSQLNERKLDTGSAKKSKFKEEKEEMARAEPPTLGVFRESGAIEQSSDACFVLQRIDASQAFRQIQLIDGYLLKQRGGRLGKIPFKFTSEWRLFEEIANPHRDEHPYQPQVHAASGVFQEEIGHYEPPPNYYEAGAGE